MQRSPKETKIKNALSDHSIRFMVSESRCNIAYIFFVVILPCLYKYSIYIYIWYLDRIQDDSKYTKASPSYSD